MALNTPRRLPLAELRDFMAVPASRRAAPLPTMVLRGVVKIKGAAGRVRAPVQVLEIGFYQEPGDLARENRQGQFFTLERRPVTR